MSRFALFTCVTAAALLAAPGFAQEQKSAAKKEGATTSESGAVKATTVFRAGKITGMKVRNPEGEDLGKIKEIVLDLEDQSVRYAAVTFGGFLGVGDKLFAVPMEALTLKHGQDDTYFLLDLPKDKLEKAPGFNDDNWPDFGNDRWAADVRKYYGKEVKPQTVRGTVVAATENKLVVKDESGKRHTYNVGPNVSIMQAGDKIDLDELQPNHRVAINLEPREGKPVVTQVESLGEAKTTKTSEKSSSSKANAKSGEQKSEAQKGDSQKSETPKSSSQTTSEATGGQAIEGTVSSLEGNTLKIKDAQGKEHSFELSDDVKVTVGGEASQRDQLKAGQEVKILATKEGDKQKATQVTADKAAE